METTPYDLGVGLKNNIIGWRIATVLQNRANFGTPNPAIFSGTTISPSAGLITTTTTTSRQLQLGVKLVF